MFSLLCDNCIISQHHWHTPHISYKLHGFLNNIIRQGSKIWPICRLPHPSPSFKTWRKFHLGQCSPRYCVKMGAQFTRHLFLVYYDLVKHHPTTDYGLHFTQAEGLVVTWYSDYISFLKLLISFTRLVVYLSISFIILQVEFDLLNSFR